MLESVSLNERKNVGAGASVVRSSEALYRSIQIYCICSGLGFSQTVLTASQFSPPTEVYNVWRDELNPITDKCSGKLNSCCENKIKRSIPQ